MPVDDPGLEAKIMDYWYAAITLERAARDCARLFRDITMPEKARHRVAERGAWLAYLAAEAEFAREEISKYIGPNRTVDLHRKEEKNNG